MRGAFAFAIGFVVASAAGEASAESRTLRLQVTVPEICRADHPGAVAARGVSSAALGVVDLLCNSSTPRALVIAHPGGADAAGVEFVFDGRTVAAGASGVTRIDLANAPVRSERSLALNADNPLSAAFPVSVSLDVAGGGSPVQSAGAAPSKPSGQPTIVAAQTNGDGALGASDGRNATLISVGGRGVFRF